MHTIYCRLQLYQRGFMKKLLLLPGFRRIHRLALFLLQSIRQQSVVCIPRRTNIAVPAGKEPPRQKTQIDLIRQDQRPQRKNTDIRGATTCPSATPKGFVSAFPPSHGDGKTQSGSASWSGRLPVRKWIWGPTTPTSWFWSKRMEPPVLHYARPRGFEQVPFENASES